MLITCALLLAGCGSSGWATPGAYDIVDGIAAELKISEAGELLVENRYGGGSLSSTPSTHVAVIAGETATETLRASLTSAGFTLESDDGPRSSWTRSYGAQVSVTLLSLDSGDSAGIGAESDFQVEQPGAAIWIDSYD